MRNSVMKALAPSLIKPLITKFLPDGKTSPETQQGDHIREHILLGGVSDTGRVMTQSDVDSGFLNNAPVERSDVANDLREIALGTERGTTTQATLPAKPLGLDSGEKSVFLDLQHNYVLGTNDDDMIMGSLEADRVLGFNGDDNIQSLHGNDTVFGGNGDDTINGGLGDDQLYGDDGNDELYGSVGRDVLFGRSGDDFLEGGDGEDVLHGGSGNDELVGGKDNDKLMGWGGNDTLDGGDGDDTLDGQYGHNDLFGGKGDDVLIGAEGNDLLEGGNGNDTLEGEDGHDTLDGGNDDDVLDGGAGVDNLYGGLGNDLLSGGANDGQTPWGDYLTGGSGSDVFWFEMGESGGDTSMDVIWDFSQGIDQLAFVNNEADTLFLGEANGFTDAPGAQAYYEHTTNDFGDVTIMHVRDANGFESDIDVIIKGHHNLTMDDMAFG